MRDNCNAGKPEKACFSRFTLHVLCFTFTALICLSSAVGQSDTGKIEGQVINKKENLPLSQQLVVLQIHREGEDVQQRETVTDDSGAYIFDDLSTAFDVHYAVSTNIPTPAARARGGQRPHGVRTQPQAFVGNLVDHRFCLLGQGGQAPHQIAKARGAIAQARCSAEIVAHPFLDDRPRDLPNHNVRIKTARHPFGHDHGLLKKKKLRLRLHLKRLGGLQKLGEKARDRDLVRRTPENRFTNRPARLGERTEGLIGRNVARLEMHLRRAPVVAFEERQQQLRQVEARLPVETPHDAEVDGEDVALGVGKQVAGMEVGVEKAVAEHLAQKRLAAGSSRQRPGRYRRLSGPRDR